MASAPQAKERARAGRLPPLPPAFLLSSSPGIQHLLSPAAVAVPREHDTWVPRSSLLQQFTFSRAQGEGGRWTTAPLSRQPRRGSQQTTPQHPSTRGWTLARLTPAHHAGQEQMHWAALIPLHPPTALPTPSLQGPGRSDLTEPL